MLELIVAAGVILGLLALKFGNEHVDPEALLRWSAGLIAAGLALGLPGSLVYHIKLARALAAAHRAERRWWWRPTHFHTDLTADERRRILPWFQVGVAGFLVVVAGCILLFLLALRFS